MEKIVNIIPATNILPDRNQVFSYICPPAINLKSGQKVIIPFAGRKIVGIVDYGHNKYKKSKYKLKSIIKPAKDDFILSKDHYQLAKWIAEHYYCSLGLAIKIMLQKEVKARDINSVETGKRNSFPELNQEQLVAYEKISEITKKSFLKPILIHGITGSGKTEVYMRLIKDNIENNKQTIILIPEISLTPQTTERFTKRFGAKMIAILHSRQSSGEKYYYWKKIYENTAKIIIGPRSAIFAPAKKLGLIIIDEEHDSSFKQYDQNPRYHAREVAEKLAQIKKIPLVLGSATPSIESYYKSTKGAYYQFRLKNRYREKLKLPPVKIIDMREELKKGNYSILSERLYKDINKVLERKKQIMLFINRRGSSTFVMCRDCGHVLECPYCSVSLTYHTSSKSNKMICHHCGYVEEVSPSCPKCQSKYIKYFGVGTQKVEKEILSAFPNSRIIRIDKDTMNKKNIHQDSYDKINRQDYDIIIGTQMITKGLDLSKIELVGIIACDVLFNFPDFRTNERAFQSITQVAGRTSRRENTGKVVLQTYNPENKIIKFAADHEYRKFYQKEILLRKDLSYPPFSNIIKLIFEGLNYEDINNQAKKCYDIIKDISNIEIIGPAPAFIPKRRNKYQINIIIKYLKSDIKKQILNIIPKEAKVDIDPENLL